jgi:protein phosphatase inhibitor 2
MSGGDPVTAAAPRKKAIVWDEDNLQHNEANRTAKMKIDEPKTPFNHDYKADAQNDDDDDDDNDDNNDSRTVGAKKRNASDAVDLGALHAKIATLAAEKQRLGDQVWHPNELVKDKNAFVDSRKKHYNEFQTVRALAAQQQEDDDDDDDDSDDS